MSQKELDARQATALINQLVGEFAWGPRLGVGTFLTLEFGAPEDRLEASGPVHGRWHLWVYSSAWRIEHGGEIITGSEDARNQVQESLHNLDGVRVESIELNAQSDLAIVFGGEFTLRLFAHTSRDSEHWMLWHANNQIVVSGSDNKLYVEERGK